MIFPVASLIDSNILIDNLRQVAKARDKIRDIYIRDGRLVSSVICRAEVLNGMLPREEKHTLEFLGRFEWLPVTSEITDISSAYYRQFHKSHGVVLFDSLIAGTAKSHSLDLITANKRHYPMEDIKIVQPY